jgi:YihY family inner membrane protein
VQGGWRAIETNGPGYDKADGRAHQVAGDLSVVQRVLRALDRAQRAHTVPAVAFAVQKKYGDDGAGNLASLLSFSGFVTLFPLLLLAVTVLGLVLSGDPHLRGDILRSTFAQFPLMGTELRSNVHALHRNSLIGLVVAVVLLFYGSFGLAGNGIYAMEQIWNLPGTDRVNFLKRTGRSAEFILLLGAGLLVSTFLSGAATNTASRPLLVDAGAIVLSLLVSCGQFVLAYRVLTPSLVKTRSLLPGAIVAGIGWTVLQSLGTYLVGHQLKNSDVYGVFAFVLGLLFWISLVTRLVAYTAELNVVLSRRLWPRSLVQPPLTPADRVVLAAQAEQNRRRPEQLVRVSFELPAEEGEAGPGEDELSGGSPPSPSSAAVSTRPRSPSSA